MTRAAVLGVMLALTLAGGAEAAAPPVKLSLRSLDPAKIVKRGALSVRVVARSKGKLRVSAGRLARAKTVRFKRRGRKTVRLKLTARGRRTLGACGTRRRVTVKAARKKTRRLLRRQRRCFTDSVILPPPPPAPPPLPTGASVYEPWDAGPAFNALAPNANTPPVESGSNQDPHGVSRRTPAAQQQKSDHLRLGGTITDRCAGGPCQGAP